MGDKIVVFGGSGFIGSHVCDKLSDADYNVHIFDIQKSPYLRQEQTMIVGDILDDRQVRNAISGAKAVYNFAGIADIDDASNRPIDTVRYNMVVSDDMRTMAFMGKKWEDEHKKWFTDGLHVTIRCSRIYLYPPMARPVLST